MDSWFVTVWELLIFYNLFTWYKDKKLKTNIYSKKLKVRLFEIKLRQKIVYDPQIVHKISKKLASNQMSTHKFRDILLCKTLTEEYEIKFLFENNLFN